MGFDRLKYFGYSVIAPVVISMVMLVFQEDAPAVAFIGYIGMFVLACYAAAQRLKNLNQPVLLWLLVFVPLVNLIFGLYLLFAPPAYNRHGKLLEK